MNMKNPFVRAQTVLQALMQGTDPQTGNELPEDSVVNRIDVNRAMHVAVVALEQMTARAARRSQLPAGVGRTWTDDEERKLREEFANGEPIPLIATKHERTIRAIEARLQRMDLLQPEQRTTSNSFIPVTKEPK